MNHYIFCDISGTNSTFSLQELEKKEFKELYRHIYKTQEYSSFEDILNSFLDLIKLHEIENYTLLIAAAGTLKLDEIIVKNGGGIKINKEEISRNFNFHSISIMNDFSAISYYTMNPIEKNLLILNKGESYGNSSLIIGAGTGLGVSLVENNKVIDPRNSYKELFLLDEKCIEEELYSHLNRFKKKEKLEYEDILSGRGIENLYEHYSGEKLSAQEISSQKNIDENARKTFEIFFKIYAQFIRKLAIEYMTQNSIYIAGGIIEKNLDFDHKEFIREFSNSENHREFLERIPIYIIKNYDCTLFGLQNYVIINQ